MVQHKPQEFHVSIFTDGACSVQSRCGGCAAILRYKDRKKIVSTRAQDTTNNRMELMAVIIALETLNKKCRVKIYSDSKYITRAFNESWIEKWKRNGWHTTNGPVANLDLWETILKLLDEKTTKYEFVWIRGHDGNKYNEEADQWACLEKEMAIKELMKS